MPRAWAGDPSFVSITLPSSGLDVLYPLAFIREQSAVCLACDRTTFVQHTGTSYNNKLMLIFRMPLLAHYH